ncbi:hypothetical protein SteCoe_36683 [Stentor coeruleus]|uniref:Major facilitator superfamily (MFS) profile domain-containing protein n=1 Tax=Stentor coeruleus TaxID=5963 RepID=A0A1R2APM2_9CILI|nr:hypothetical protein SteCoe_36683 [Stentor coeruleus]
MRNWCILISYCGAAFINGVAWVTLIPISDKAMDYYNINDAELTMYSYSYALASVPLAPISAWIISKSFFATLHIVWTLNLMGCWLRYIAHSNFLISFSGQLSIALGNMLMLSSCSTLASLWFPPSQILFATSIASTANFIGMSLGFAYMPYCDSISTMMLIQAIISSILFAFNLLVLKKDHKHKIFIPFKESFILSLKDKILVGLTLSAGSGLAVNYALISILGLLLESENYSSVQTGWTGFTFLASGLLGALIATYMAEVKKATKGPLMIILVSALISSIVFAGILSFRYYSLPAVAFYGASITGFLPLSIRYCVEFAPTIDESVITNMIFFSAQVFSCIYTFPIQYWKAETKITGFWIASVLILLSFGILFMLVAKFSRPSINNLDKENLDINCSQSPDFQNKSNS